MLALSFFFFNDTATTEIYTLSLHDALPICLRAARAFARRRFALATPRFAARAFASRRLALRTSRAVPFGSMPPERDRKSTRLNSSHANISYAVFCLKKKKVRNQASALSDL